MSCIPFSLNRQDMGEGQSLQFAQQVEWGVGKNSLAVSLVPWLVDIMFSLGNSSPVLSRVILSPVSQLSLIASRRNVETNDFSACPIRFPSPVFIVSVWNQSHHLSSAWTEERENILMEDQQASSSRRHFENTCCLIQVVDPKDKK